MTHVTNTNTSAALLQGVVSSQLASGSSQLMCCVYIKFSNRSATWNRYKHHTG